MKYIKYRSKGNLVGLKESVLSYWEIDQTGHVVRSIEIKPNGELHKYSESHLADAYGQLPEGVITNENLSDKSYGSCTELTGKEFQQLWET